MVRKLILASILLAGTLSAAQEPLQRDTQTKALIQTELDLKGVTLTIGSVTVSDSAGIRTITLGSTNGTKIGATGDKIGFLGATPIVRPSSTTDLRQALINIGLYTTGGATPLNLNGGAFTASSIAGTTGTFSSTMGITGNTTVGGTLGVTGAITGPSLSLSGNALVGGTLGVTGASTLAAVSATSGIFSSTLSVTGATSGSSFSYSGNGTVGGTFGATGNSTFGGTLGITGLLSGSSFSFSGNGAVTGDLDVTGELSGTTGLFSGPLSAESGEFVSSISVTSASDSGLDLGSGTTVTRQSDDGALRLTSQNNVTEIVGRANITDTFNLASGGEVSVVKYGAVGDGVTNDTASFNAAIAVANAADSTIYIPDGVWLLTPGALSDITCNVRGPNAILKSVGGGGPLVSIRYSENQGNAFRTFHIRQLLGNGPSRAGTGLYIKGCDYSTFTITDIRFFAEGVHFDGSGNNLHVGVSTFAFETIMACDIGILMNSGDNDAKQCESNNITVNYMQEMHVAGVYLGLGQYSTAIDENLISINSLEVNVPNADGIVVAAEGIRNSITVHGILGGVSGTGKLVRSSGTDNHFRLATANEALLVKLGADIWDTDTTAKDGSARSRTVGFPAPTVGYHRVGDIQWNNATDYPVGWFCTVAGTPGTFQDILLNNAHEIILQGSDSGLDLSGGTTVTRRSADGRLRLTSQNSLTEVVGDLTITGSLIGSITPVTVSGNVGAGFNQSALTVQNSAGDTGFHIVNQATNGRDWALFSSGGASGLGQGYFSIADTIGGVRLSISPAGVITGNGSGLTGLTVSQIGGAGTMAAQNANNVAITGGTIAGIIEPALTAPALQNGWVNFGASTQTAGYYKDLTGRVWLTGVIKDGTATTGTTMFTLPAGYRSMGVLEFAVSSNDAHGAVEVVSATGAVNFKAGTNAWLSLDGISFRTY